MQHLRHTKIASKTLKWSKVYLWYRKSLFNLIHFNLDTWFSVHDLVSWCLLMSLVISAEVLQRSRLEEECRHLRTSAPVRKPPHEKFRNADSMIGIGTYIKTTQLMYHMIICILHFINLHDLHVIFNIFTQIKNIVSRLRRRLEAELETKCKPQECSASC